MRGTAETPGHRNSLTRRRSPFAICYPTVVILWAVAAAHAQSGGGYVIKKSTMDGGGRAATSGTYHVSGTVGQHDAPDLAGGTYVLNGGFWYQRRPSEAIPTVSEWGLAVLALILATAATMILAQRHCDRRVYGVESRRV